MPEIPKSPGRPPKIYKDPLKWRRKWSNSRTVEYFIPAMALEHPSNGEYLTREQRIKWAVLRWDQKKDFNCLLEVIGPIPYVVLDTVKFNAEKMGYDVRAFIRSE